MRWLEACVPGKRGSWFTWTFLIDLMNLVLAREEEVPFGIKENAADTVWLLRCLL